MHRKILYLWIMFIVAAGLLLASCAQSTPVATQIPPSPVKPTDTPAPTATVEAQPILLEDGFGHTVSLKGPAQRVISLAPANTEILFAIGAGSQVVGRDQFSDFPEQAKSVADIGGGFGELNVEAIVSLKPDLVLASELTPPEQLKALEPLGINAFILKNPTQLDGLYDNLKIVGRLTGHEAEAESLAQDLKARVAAVEEKVSKVETRPLVFYENDSTDPNAIWTPGPGSFIDTLLKMAGGENLGNILDTQWGQVSIENLIAKDPDIILLGDATWGGVTVEAVKARENWAGLKAVKEGRIYPFDDNLVSRPGPRLVDGLEALAKLLHPDLFK